MAKVFHVLTASLLLAVSAGSLHAQNSEGSRYLKQPMPESWAFSQEVSQTLPSDDKWWKAFGDSTLDSLISLGIDNNYNIKEAAHRREMARLSMQQTKAGYYPTVGMSAGYSRAYSNHTGGNKFSLGADVNWEFDLFGKITSKVRASKAGLDVSRADYVATMVSMTAEIVTYYINYRVLQTQIAVANEHIQYQDTVVKITEARYAAGLVSKLDVAQAKTVYYSTEATLPRLEAQAQQALNALGVLLGVYPAELEPVLGPLAKLPSYHHIIPAGVPANLLRRRPDIAAAEATLAQYAAQIGVAKKDFLPTISLKGSIGWGGDRLNNMVNSDSFSYSIAPQLSWTLFDGLSRKYAVARAKEQMMLGIDDYNLTVMTAFIEVENAMQSYQAALSSLELDKEVFNQSHEAFVLSMEQYKQGLSPFTNVVNAQIDWLNYANALVSAHGDALVALVDLYKALGGSPIQ
ncbi:MAG: TolC family protein [Paenibacillus sp.]|nr:TolC family protein [Paenibacillus sp.]